MSTSSLIAVSPEQGGGSQEQHLDAEFPRRVGPFVRVVSRNDQAVDI